MSEARHDKSARRRVALVLWLVAAAAVAGIIIHFSAEPAGVSDETSRGVLRTILEFFFGESNEETIVFYDHFIRKAAHFTLFAALGFSLAAALVNQDRLPRFWPALIAGALFAVSDEVHQYFVPGRSCEFRDMMIDFSGIVTGALVVTLVVYLWQKLRRRKQS